MEWRKVRVAAISYFLNSLSPDDKNYQMQANSQAGLSCDKTDAQKFAVMTDMSGDNR